MPEGGFSADVLCGIGLFGALDDEALFMLGQRLQSVQLGRDEQLYAQGDSGRVLFIVLRGEMVLHRTCQPDTTAIERGRFRRGDWFGERAVMEMMPRPCSAVAAEPTRLIKMSASDCDALYRYNVKAYALLMMNIARQLSRKLHALQRRLEMCS